MRGQGSPLSLVLLVGALGAGLCWRATTRAVSEVPVLVEVVGDVERPGIYALSAPTSAQVLLRAGGSGGDDRPLRNGDRVVVGRTVDIERADDSRLFGEPLDPNVASAEALDALPGVGEATAAAIVSDRTERGPYRRVTDLQRVRSLRGERFARLKPYLVVEPSRLSLTTASVAELTTLPGVGPVLATRIVASRASEGPFVTIGSLTRVRGVGQALVDRIRDQVEP